MTKQPLFVVSSQCAVLSALYRILYVLLFALPLIFKFKLSHCHLEFAYFGYALTDTQSNEQWAMGIWLRISVFGLLFLCIGCLASGCHIFNMSFQLVHVPSISFHVR